MSLDTIFWLAVLVVTVVVEASTAGLVSIWFTVGAAAAVLCSMLGGAVWLQVVWFLAVSLIALLLTRPLLRKYVYSRSEPTNADRSIGRTVLVTEDIDNLRSSGAVKIDGILWTARSLSDEVIPAGSAVVIREIRGVTLYVEPRKQEV